MTEVQITRKAVVVVDTVGENNYGDLTFTDKGGASYKISNKRKQYFTQTIQPNTGVELSYAMSSFGKEYIYSARKVQDAIQTPTTPIETPREKEVMQDAHQAAQPQPNPQAVGMVTKEIGDMQRAKLLTEIFGIKVSIELVKWYRSQVLGITRVPFDGKDLPDFTKKGA